MQFQLRANKKASFKVVELNEQLRMPLEAYNSSHSCLISDTLEMADLNWKIVLDEAFRSINREGFLEFRVRESEPYDLRRLWLFLGQPSYNRLCSLISYQRIEGNLHFVQLQIIREKQDQESWSICYISNGGNITQINRTAEIMRNNPKVEILVSGPKDKLLDLESNVIVIDDQHFVRNAMISAKKNAMVERAQNQNLLLIHERYQISETFIKDFDEFGYDFSVAVPKQLYFGSSVEYPGLLVEVNGKVRSVEQQVSRADFFVNGGCIVIKKDLARTIPQNSFLAWQEMEDIDWSARLIQNGEIPRPVRNAVVYTVGTDLSKTASIKPIYFEVGKIDFLSELDCLAANHPTVFFEHMPDLILTYFRDSKYRSRLLARIKSSRESWDSLSSIHLTPLRFSFVLTLSLVTKFGRKPVEISRRRISRQFFSYMAALFLKNRLKVLLIIPASIYLFSRKPSTLSSAKILTN